MRIKYETSLTIGSGIIQAAAAIVVIKLNISSLELYEVQLWIISLAILPFYALLEFGVTNVLPQRLSKMNNMLAERISYIRRFENRAAIFHLASVFIVLSVLIVLNNTQIIKISSAWQLVFLSILIALRGYSNVTLGIIYSLGLNVREKELRLVATLVNLCALTILSINSRYTFIELLSINYLTTIGTIFTCKIIIARKHNNIPIHSASVRALEKISKDEVESFKTSLPSMFVINSLPFIIAANLSASDNINFSIAQQVFSGIGIVVLAPIVISYKKITDLYLSDLSEARNFLLRIVYHTVLILISCQTVLWLTLDYFLDYIKSGSALLDREFILLFIAFMSFEWIQTVVTRGGMASGYYNFWRQTAASAFLTIFFALILSVKFGLYGVLWAVVLAQIPTCHYFNTKVVLARFNATFRDFFRASAPYFYTLPLIILMILK